MGKKTQRLFKSMRSLGIILEDITMFDKADVAACFNGRPVPIAGFLCEFRCFDVSLGISYHVTRHKVKESTAEFIYKKLTTSKDVKIVQVNRKHKDNTYK